MKESISWRLELTLLDQTKEAHWKQETLFKLQMQNKKCLMRCEVDSNSADQPLISGNLISLGPRSAASAANHQVARINYKIIFR